MQEKSLIPQKPERLANRSIEVTRTYLHTGEAVTRSLWVKVSPRHPLLKLVMAPLVISAALAIFVLIMLILAITLLAVALVWTLSKPKRGKSRIQ